MADSPAGGLGEALARVVARQSEVRFQQLAEAAPDTITVIQDGRFVWANARGVEVLGFDTLDEFLSRPLDELLSPEEIAVMRDRLRRVAAGEQLAPRDYGARRKDGSIVPIEVSSILIEWNGRPAFLSFARDVSQRKRMHEELLQADRLVTIGNLAAGVAHEINNPLTYVLLHLDRLQAQLPRLVPDAHGRTAAEQLIDEAREGAERVRSIVRELLAFARTDGDDRGVVDVGRAVDSAIKLARTILNTRATVVCHYEPVPPFRGNEMRLSQVFLNLIVNAAQAIGDRGHIEASMRQGANGEIVVEIADDGPGFDDGQLRRLFEPFYTTKPPGKGTGLGLAMTRAIVEGMGGQVFATNRHPRGARMTVILPAPALQATAGDPAIGRPPVRPTLTRQRPHVVIVDDEPRVARAIASDLELDHDVTWYTDPRRAVNELAAAARVPDVVLCDLNMPDVSGIDLLRDLTGHNPAYASRFVFITGGAVSERAEQFLRLSAVPVVHKPFDMTDLRGVIETRIGEAAAPM